MAVHTAAVHFPFPFFYIQSSQTGLEISQVDCLSIRKKQEFYSVPAGEAVRRLQTCQHQNNEDPKTAAAGGVRGTAPAPPIAAAAGAAAAPLLATSSGPMRVRNSSLSARCTSAVVCSQLMSRVSTGKNRPSSD